MMKTLASIRCRIGYDSTLDVLPRRTFQSHAYRNFTEYVLSDVTSQLLPSAYYLVKLPLPVLQ